VKDLKQAVEKMIQKRHNPQSSTPASVFYGKCQIRMTFHGKCKMICPPEAQNSKELDWYATPKTQGPAETVKRKSCNI
jgi:hypothetical protein